MSNEYSLVDFIRQLIKWKKELILAAIAIAVISIVGSLLMPNYYKAETTFYAASPDLAKPIPIGGEDKDVRIYGDDKDLDRLFTIAGSNELIYFLVDSFDLYAHYKIKKEDPKSKYKVREKFLKNYKTIKTKYGALELIVEDKDPEMATNIANTARDIIGQLGQKVIKLSQKSQIESYDRNITQRQMQMDSLSEKFRKLKEESGVFDIYNQTKIYSELLADAESSLEDARGKISYFKNIPSKRDSVIKYQAVELGALSKKEKAENELKRFSPVASLLKQYDQELANIVLQISYDKERLKQLGASYDSPFKALHLIESAVVPVEKSRPKRSIIVLLSCMMGVALSILAVLIIDSLRSSGIIKK